MIDRSPRGRTTLISLDICCKLKTNGFGIFGLLKMGAITTSSIYKRRNPLVNLFCVISMFQWAMPYPGLVSTGPTPPDAIQPGHEGRWDDMSTWTGSIIRRDGQWYMYYTGASSREKGLVQRIGLAVSDDLTHWKKHPGNPLLEADPRWYELLDLNRWHDQAWRDPWIFYHDEDFHYHAFITARANHGPNDERGVIGHARSTDLFSWEVLPPVSKPGDFGHLEVPQLITNEGDHYLLFSCPLEYQSTNWRNSHEVDLKSGTHYLVSESPLGPFHLSSKEFMVGDCRKSFYSGKLIQDPTGDWVFLAFLNYDSSWRICRRNIQPHVSHLLS